MVPDKAQFDDRIRNLLALAQDNSVESRTLLFSHICDLFLQKRPMESDNQIRMLIDIVNELINDVDVNIRIELRNILLSMDRPPTHLLKLISEDKIDVSGKLLEDAYIDEEQLLYLIKYASDDHRDHINRRFGLSPLIRVELDNARKASERAKSTVTQLAASLEKKVSLQELEEAEQNSKELTEDATANILEILRTNKFKSRADISIVAEQQDISSYPTATEEEEEDEPLSLTSKIARMSEEMDISPTHVDEAPLDASEENTEDDYRQISVPEDAEDTDNIEDLKEAMERLVEQNTAPPIAQAPSATDEWFWEIDRYGNIKYLSDNSEAAFLKAPFNMVGEDFLCLWHRPGTDESNSNEFITIFEKRLPYRDEPFSFKISPSVVQNYLLSAIATFDIDTGRFTGFRGSAQIDQHQIEPVTAEIENTSINFRENNIHAISENLAQEKNEDIIHMPEFSAHLDQADTDNPQKVENQQTPHHDNSGEQDKVASELLHNLSHEFRTPLNAIIGFSQMIDSEMWGPVSEHYKKNTKDIIDAANHLKDTVNNILDSAKMEAGLIEPSPESFSLNSIIQDAMIAIAPIIESKELKVSGIDDNIDVILYNDKHCIMLCLVKIITYATKQAQLGDDLHISVLVNSNGEVRIEVPLINQHINENESGFLFQKMHDTNTQETTPAQKKQDFKVKISSEFGLSVAQEIAEMVGGSISTFSQNGRISHLVLTISTYPN